MASRCDDRTRTILVLQLVEKGRLELDGTLSEYLPEFDSPWASEITLHHLLSHTSGLPDYFLAIDGYMDRTPPPLSREEAMELVAGMQIQFQPGSAFDYSNTGFVLLGQILEAETGQPYAEILSHRILEPLGMNGTRWRPDLGGPGLPRFYEADGSPAQDDAYLAGEGGIVSTLEDMVKFARALGSPALLSESMWERAWTPHGDPRRAFQDRPSNASPYGYGFQLFSWGFGGDAPPRELVGHLGIGYGSSSLLLRTRSDDRILIAWNNKSISPFNPALLDGFLSVAE